MDDGPSFLRWSQKLLTQCDFCAVLRMSTTRVTMSLTRVAADHTTTTQHNTTQHNTNHHKPPQTTTNHNKPQRNHNEPQRTTTNHNEPQRTTTDHNGQQRTTTNHNEPQRTTTDNNGPTNKQTNKQTTTIWSSSVLTGEEHHALSQVGGPSQSQPSHPMSSRHHISTEHRQRWKHLLLNLIQILAAAKI